VAEDSEKAGAAAATTGVVVGGSTWGTAGSGLGAEVGAVVVVLDTASVEDTGLMYSAVVAGRAG